MELEPTMSKTQGSRRQKDISRVMREQKFFKQEKLKASKGLEPKKKAAPDTYHFK